jgi:hypothetical protein
MLHGVQGRAISNCAANNPCTIYFFYGIRAPIDNVCAPVAKWVMSNEKSYLVPGMKTRSSPLSMLNFHLTFIPHKNDSSTRQPMHLPLTLKLYKRHNTLKAIRSSTPNAIWTKHPFVMRHINKNDARQSHTYLKSHISGREDYFYITFIYFLQHRRFSINFVPSNLTPFSVLLCA